MGIDLTSIKIPKNTGIRRSATDKSISEAMSKIKLDADIKNNEKISKINFK